MINIRAKGRVNVAKMAALVNRGISGNPRSPGRALVGPTKQAWYGMLHEFGLGKFPPRPFAYPALLNSRHLFPMMFKGLLNAPRPALVRAAIVVEREMKTLLDVGGGADKIPSPPGQPPHTQSGTLKNSVTHEIEQ